MKRCFLPPFAVVFPALLAVSSVACGAGDSTGCGDEPSLADQRCSVLAADRDIVYAALAPGLAPLMQDWDSARVVIAAGGTGWLRVDSDPWDEWAVVVAPPIPFQVFSSPSAETPADGTVLAMTCEAAGILFEARALAPAWIRLGPTEEREVTVGFWSADQFACE